MPPKHRKSPGRGGQSSQQNGSATPTSESKRHGQYQEEDYSSGDDFEDEDGSDDQFSNFVLLCLAAVVAGLAIGYAIISAPPREPPVPYSTPAGKAAYLTQQQQQQRQQWQQQPPPAYSPPPGSAAYQTQQAPAYPTSPHAAHIPPPPASTGSVGQVPGYQPPPQHTPPQQQQAYQPTQPRSAPHSSKPPPSSNDGKVYAPLEDTFTVPITRPPPSSVGAADSAAAKPKKAVKALKHTVPIAVLAYNRAKLLRRTMEALFKQPGVQPQLIYIFQDGKDAEVAALCEMYVELKGVKHLYLPDGHFAFLSANHPETGEKVYLRHRMVPGHETNARIAHNYFNIFGHMFQKLQAEAYTSIVVLEDDLFPAPDFIEFFEEGNKLMGKDESIFVVSAWNDNGHVGYVSNQTQLLRGEHFMALGWLLTRQAYTQIVTCREPGCWMGCPDDPSGLEVCLGQWDTPFKGYFHAQQRAGNKLVGVFPEVPRVHHLFETDGFTTTSDLQVHWFDNMELATRAPGSAPVLRAKHAALAAFAQSTEALLRRAVVLADGTAAAGGPGCVHDLLHMRPGVFALYINATDRGDQLWALVASGLSTTVGYAGHEGYIPRGIHEGVVRTRWAGHQLLIVGKFAPVTSLPSLTARTPYGAEQLQQFFQPAPVATEAKTCNPRLSGGGSGAPAPKDLRVRRGAAGVGCDATCLAVGEQCAPQYFLHVNRCEELSKAFKCEACAYLPDGHGPEHGGSRLGRSLLGDAEFHFPGHKHPLDGDGTCVVTNPRYFNCSAAAPGILRLCPCTATK